MTVIGKLLQVLGHIQNKDYGLAETRLKILIEKINKLEEVQKNETADQKTVKERY